MAVHISSLTRHKTTNIALDLWNLSFPLQKIFQNTQTGIISFIVLLCVNSIPVFNYFVIISLKQQAEKRCGLLA